MLSVFPGHQFANGDNVRCAGYRAVQIHNIRLIDLPLEEFQALDSSLDNTVYEVLGVENAIAAFSSYGSTAPDEVKRQIQRWKIKLDDSQPTNKS